MRPPTSSVIGNWHATPAAARSRAMRRGARGQVLASPNAWIRSVPTYTTPCAMAGVLYLPPTPSASGALRQTTCNVSASRAYSTGTAGPTSGWARGTSASSTQISALLASGLLVTTGDPGLRKATSFAVASTARYAAWPGPVTTRSRATPGGTAWVESSAARLEPDTNSTADPSACL